VLKSLPNSPLTAERSEIAMIRKNLNPQVYSALANKTVDHPMAKASRPLLFPSHPRLMENAAHNLDEFELHARDLFCHGGIFLLTHELRLLYQSYCTRGVGFKRDVVLSGECGLNMATENVGDTICVAVLIESNVDRFYDVYLPDMARVGRVRELSSCRNNSGCHSEKGSDRATSLTRIYYPTKPVRSGRIA
jgi:hypothetical protein